MAVAADSHRDFLTPEHAIQSHARQRIPNGIQMNCVYSFAILFYHTVRRLSIPKETFAKIGEILLKNPCFYDILCVV